jgi:hypothetical protein
MSNQKNKGTVKKEIKNQKLKSDITNKLNKKEAKLALLILSSIEREGKINHKTIQELANKVFEEDSL